MRLKDKVAIITGGSVGIGKGITLGFVREGAKVVITARNEERLKKTEGEIKSMGGEVLALRSDVSVMKDINELVEKTMQRFGKIDILVNNAAMMTPPVPFLHRTEEIFDQIIQTNLKGLYFLTQAVAKRMVEKKYGKIIHISSGHGRVGIPGNSEYAATKGALISITRVMAVELASLGINVNSIVCGLTQTEGYEALNYPKEITGMVVGMTPLKRMGMPEDYVGIAVFMASDESAFMTGQSISVDGGVVMP
jgi:3-oxoacyl-[acyl-carrier protein] reductase